MNVRELMTLNPVACLPTAKVREAARLMADNDCGCIPVVEDEKSKRLVGVITDRDIAMRAVAAGHDGASDVADIMSHPIASILDTASVEECLRFMETNQLRRAPVVDPSGCLVGIVAQADVAQTQRSDQVCTLLREVSQGFGPGRG